MIEPIRFLALPPSCGDVSVHFAGGGMVPSWLHTPGQLGSTPRSATGRSYPRKRSRNHELVSRRPAVYGFDFNFGCDLQFTLTVYSDDSIALRSGLSFTSSKTVTQTLTPARLARAFYVMVPRYFRALIVGLRSTHTIFRSYFP